MDFSHLRQLAHIILKSIDEIENIVKPHSSGLPDLNVPVTDHATEQRVYADIQAPAAAIRASCGQLAASVAPGTALKDAYSGHILSSCIKVVGCINVPEILREAGPQGLQVREICKHSSTDPQKISRVLRLLASHHIFREVTPDVFTNNRLSSFFDSGNSVHDLFYKPGRKRSDKFRNARGPQSALVELMVDDMFAAANKLTDFLTNPATAFSTEVTDAPINLAFNTHLPMMEWQQLPENELRRTRFDTAMSSFSSREGSLPGFDWAAMQPGSKIVDVGGGYGTLWLGLAQEQRHLKYIVQDLPGVLDGATAFWKEKNPQALECNRIQFQAHNFLKPQPLSDATLFIVHQVLHNWTDPYALQILQHLRSAAQPTTRLVIIGPEVPMACAMPVASDVPRYGFPAWLTTAPAPLLPNYGRGGLRPYYLDLLMMLGFNGQERTVTQHQSLLREAGWDLKAVHYIPESGNMQVVALPRSV